MKITIVGSGVVGQATGRGLMSKGHSIKFLDIRNDLLLSLRRQGFEAHHPDFLEHEDADMVMFCVNTPATKNGADLSYLENAVAKQSEHLRETDKYSLMVIRSTIPPHTTRKLITLMEKVSGKSVGKDFGVCVQPEFLRAKSAEEDFLHPWLTIIGETDRFAGDMLESLYRDWSGRILRTTIETAEMVKMAHNAFNATKISFANAIWRLADPLEIDGNEVMKMVIHSAEASWNPEYGSIGGRPFGGACLPKDLSNLIHFAKEFGVETPLLSGVDEENMMMYERDSADNDGFMWKPSPMRKKVLS